ncbi:hypothetical protein [Streptosporangium sp. NPDC004631]
MTTWQTRLTAALATAHARLDRGREEMAAAGDDRARAITTAVNACQETLGGGRGTRRPAIEAVAAAMTPPVTVKSVDVALAKVSAGLPPRPGLPWPVWEKLAAAELADLKPLSPAQWAVLGHLVRHIALDESWISDPGGLLAQEVDDLDPDELPAGVEQAPLSQACRSWSRAASVAILEALARGEHDALPTGEAKDAAS